MTENTADRINELLSRLENLLHKQEQFSQEINVLREEIYRLKSESANLTAAEEVEKDSSTVAEEKIPEVEEVITEEIKPPLKKVVEVSPSINKQPDDEEPQEPSNLEKLIGENLINKIGIVITVIGVAIGAKYSIEHHLISPAMRIILGYSMGFILLGFGIRLKKNYVNYSAVLVSGAMAIMYFITYFAYGFYSLMPQWVAFVLMVVVTAFTVYAALSYSRQVIAHIGLVGAYTVPFLLSDESGRVAVLFSYTAIINVGILVIALKKYWKPLYYSSLLLTWLIFFAWYVADYKVDQHFELALTFLSAFFAIFYTIFLSYKLIHKEKFDVNDIILLLINSFVFFGIGYSVLDNHETGKDLLGLFTLCNAIIHFIVCAIIYKQKQADRNLLYFVVGLSLVFVTIAIPVQLNGNWVTLLWSGEAALLFWIGRAKGVSTYEILSYPLMLLAFVSLSHDWLAAYPLVYSDSYSRFTPIFNINFLTSLLFVGSYGFISYIDQNGKYSISFNLDEDLLKIISFLYKAILLFALYNAFRLEISMYWSNLYHDSAIRNIGEFENIYYNTDLLRYKTIWIICYSSLFLTLLSFLNIKWLKNQTLGFFNLGLNALLVLVFITQGLYVISELRESYLQQTLSQYYARSVFNIEVRYISFVFIVLLLYTTYRYILQNFIKKDFRIAFDIMLYITILWVASSELISWMDIAESTQSYKLGLSILWGVYSLLVVSLGIWKRKRYLRYGAIALFALTLLKLFLYDISHLDTISKTIVFVVLGVLLLLISFLYNKYKHIITEGSDDNEQG